MLGLLAVVLATVNMVGGFVVTDRMLEMFKGRGRPAAPPGRRRRGGPRERAVPDWTAIGYLVAAVCFILALKGLSSPGTARRGNQIGAFGAVLAVVVAFLSEDLKHVPLILVAIVVGTALGVPAARLVAMTQMPQLVALFNGVGGAAAALVAGLELTEPHGAGGASAGSPSPRPRRVHRARRRVSFAGSCVTFAKLQELMTTRPVTFPGGQYLFGGSLAVAVALAVARGRRRARARSVSAVAAARCSPWSRCWSACCSCCRSAAPTSRSSSRCSTPSPA